MDRVLEAVVGAAYEVSNVLGAGFLEKVYERALVKGQALRGLRASAQVAIPVSYKGHCIGQYTPDLVVEDLLIVELKCVESFSNEHLAQRINYLRASGKKLTLLLNFQRPRVEWRRVVFGLNLPRMHANRKQNKRVIRVYSRPAHTLAGTTNGARYSRVR